MAIQSIAGSGDGVTHGGDSGAIAGGRQAFRQPAIHCLRFDNRAIGVMLEPDGGYEDETFANHALAISAATTQILRVAREIADQSFPEGVDPEAGQKLSGLLVGAEILGSMLEALSHDMAVNATEERQARNRKAPA